MDYKKYKSSFIKKFEDFEKYNDEVDRESTRLKYKRFGRLFDEIKEELSELDNDEIHELVKVFNHDNNVPDCIIETVSAIGLTRLMEEDNVSKLDVIAMMLKLLGKGV